MNTQLIIDALQAAAVVLAEGCAPDHPDRQEAFKLVLDAIANIEKKTGTCEDRGHE